MQKPALLFSLDILDTILFLGKGGECWGKLGKCLSFILELLSSDLKNFHCLCRGNMQRLSVRSGHLSFVFSLTRDAELPFREEHCLSMRALSTAQLNDGYGHCNFGHVSGRIACTLPSQNAMSSGSKEAAAGDFIVADFIFDLNYTMCSLFLRATEITHLLNLRVSSKGKGSARFASSSVSSTQSQKSQ